MPTQKSKNAMPAMSLELQQKIDNTKKKLMQIREARWLAKIENSARSMQMLFENRNRSARMQGKFTIR